MKRLWMYYLTGGLLLALALLPIALWYFIPSENMRIAIIDKTVPDEQYREHNGFTWLLNHMKYKNKDGHSFQTSEDYFGFVPNDKEESFDIHALPKDYSEYDVIYLADTYGVYEEDVAWKVREREGARSDKLYGGLQAQEWDALKKRLNQPEKSLFIAEYNSFASPTEIDVMNSVTKYLGLEWSGWTGRFFDELNPHENLEIPQWVLDEFKGSWDYKGPGFILVNDLDYEVVVLEQGQHIDHEGISLSFTEEGQELFGLKNSQSIPIGLIL